jgi:hypothetical protein
MLGLGGLFFAIMLLPFWLLFKGFKMPEPATPVRP